MLSQVHQRNRMEAYFLFFLAKPAETLYNLCCMYY